MISLCVIKTEPHKYVITTTDVRDKIGEIKDITIFSSEAEARRASKAYEPAIP